MTPGRPGAGATRAGAPASLGPSLEVSMSGTDPDRIAAGAAALGLALAPDVCAALARFGDLLLRWNRSINLLARGAGPDEVLERHLLDSLALLRLGPLGGRALDVGAGAGLPGIVLAVAAPGLHVTLLEPTAKRVAFLRTAVRTLGLGSVTVRAARLEDLDPGRDPADRFDVLLSRATFAPEEWVVRAAPLRAPDGRVLVMLSQAAPPAVAAAAAGVGLRVVAEDALVLPWSGAARRNLALGA